MTELAREYGEALYALGAEEKLEKDFLLQLDTLKDIFRRESDFLRLLGNLSIPKQERVSIIDKALRDEVHPFVLSFLKLLCERGAAHEFPGCVEAYRAMYNEANGISAAVVTTAEPLSDSQRAALKEKLVRMTGHEVAMEEKIDPSLMGGVLLEMDGKRYDNTVRTRLNEIRQTMAGV